MTPPTKSVAQLPFQRDLKQQDRERDERGKLDERDSKVWQLLAYQKLKSRRRSGVEVGYGTQLFFAHHAEAVSMLGIKMSRSMISPGTIA